MRDLLKLVHLLGIAAFTGAALVALVLAIGGPSTTAEAYAVTRAAVALASFGVAAPALIVAVTSGFLLMAAGNTARMRWVQAKALLGSVLAMIALLGWLPAVDRIGAFAQSAAFGSPVLGAQQAAQRTELVAVAAVLALALAVALIAVLKPRFGRGAT